MLFIVACAKDAYRNPEELFQHVRLDALHGHLVSAQDAAEKAYQRFSGRQPEWAWKFRLLEADILLRRGLSESVLSLLTPELPSALANGDLAVKKYALVGLAYTKLGRYREGDASLREGEKLCAAIHSALAGEMATALGVLEINRGHFKEADAYFRQSLTLARQQHDDFLTAADLLNLAVVAQQEEHYDESIEWSTASQKLSQVLAYGLNEEKALGSLGWAYYKMGDFEKALSFFAEATKRAQDLGAIFDQVKWLNDLGAVESEMGQLSVATEYYRQSLVLAQKIQNKAETTDSLWTLGFVAARTGHLDIAKQYADQYAEQLGRFAQEGQDRPVELYLIFLKGEIAARKRVFGDAEKAFFEVARDPKSDIALRWEAEFSLAKLYEGEHRFDAADGRYRAALATFESARSSFHKEESRLPFMANATELYGDYLHFLIQQGKTAEALQVADYSRSQTLAEGLGLLRKNAGFSPASVNALQVARRTGSTILFYWMRPEHSYLWVATPSKLALFTLPPAAEIDVAAERYRKALLGPRDALETENPDGSRLYDMLVAPARALIPRDSRVIIVPDGSLNNLNFETLLVREPKLHYWIEDVDILNASSLKLLDASRLEPKRATASARKLLLIGDPIAPSDYGQLPGAAVEIQKIEAYFGPAQREVFARERATAPAYLESALGQFSYIHFVAHGTASRLSPLDSAIVLSKATAQDDSFKLYARDIIKRPLRANLVTISSCYGVGTRAYMGEGLVGLSWAFLRAGAHNVIGALWEVSDDSTPYLMDQLYDDLQKGQRPDVALRAAKLTLIHSNGVFRKPFYWAPFQFYVGS